MFTRQHYKAIAEIIKNEVDHWEGKAPQVKAAIDQIAYDLAVYFKQDNPQFDRDKFKVACGIDN